MRNFRIFKELRMATLEKIHYFLKRKTFKRGFELFVQGVTPTDGIYLVESGEFEVH